MTFRTRFLSLILVLLMLAGASITVNKALFGFKLDAPVNSGNSDLIPSDTTSYLPDGSAVVHTEGLPNTIEGFAGAVPLDIIIKDGKISEITPLPNSETPSFFERASEIFESWIGRTPADAIDMDVDAISGATYTSEAIISNVRAGAAYYVGTESRRSTSAPLKIWIALAVTLAACIVPLFVKNKVYHTVQLIANIIVLGFWAGQFLDYTLILKFMSGGLALPAGLVAITMLVAAFIYPLFGHPQYYCSHVCPLGSAQHLVGRIFGYKIHMSVKVLKGLEIFRRLLWGALMLLLWTDSLTGWLDLELFQAFQFESASIGIIIAACVFIALSAIISRPYCRFICPTGSLFKRSENIG